MLKDGIGYVARLQTDAGTTTSFTATDVIASFDIPDLDRSDGFNPQVCWNTTVQASVTKTVLPGTADMGSGTKIAKLNFWRDAGNATCTIQVTDKTNGGSLGSTTTTTASDTNIVSITLSGVDASEAVISIDIAAGDNSGEECCFAGGTIIDR